MGWRITGSGLMGGAWLLALCIGAQAEVYLERGLFDQSTDPVSVRFTRVSTNPGHRVGPVSGGSFDGMENPSVFRNFSPTVTAPATP